MPFCQRTLEVTSPGGAAPSLRERLAARGAEPPPDTARGSPEALADDRVRAW